MIPNLMNPVTLLHWVLPLYFDLVLRPCYNEYLRYSSTKNEHLDQIKVYQRRIYTPVLLAFVTLVHLTRKLDELIQLEASVIRQTEGATLYGPS